MTAGVWDVFLAVPMRDMHGMFLEFKSGNGKLSESQKAFRDALVNDYFFAVCWSWVEAVEKIKVYLS